MFASTISLPVAATCSGVIAFTAPCVPTGMNAGVENGPCGVENAPARASPLVPSSAKQNGCEGAGLMASSSETVDRR